MSWSIVGGRQVKGFMKEDEETGEETFMRFKFECLKVLIKHDKGGEREITRTTKGGKVKYTVKGEFGVKEFFHRDTFKSYANERFGESFTRLILQEFAVQEVNMQKNRTTDFSYRVQKKKLEQVDGKITGKTVKIPNEHEMLDATCFEIYQPFGKMITIQMYSGENIVSWICAGGHIGNWVVINHRVDSPIEVFDFNTPPVKDGFEEMKKVSKECYKESRKKFEELLGPEIKEVLAKYVIPWLFQENVDEE